MEFIEILGITAGLCTSASLLPQIIKTMKTKKQAMYPSGCSSCYFFGKSLWIYYGISKEDVAIISTNILSLVLNIIWFWP